MKWDQSLHYIQYDVLLDSFVRGASQRKIAVNDFFSVSQDDNVGL